MSLKTSKPHSAAVVILLKSNKWSVMVLAIAYLSFSCQKTEVHDRGVRIRFDGSKFDPKGIAVSGVKVEVANPDGNKLAHESRLRTASDDSGSPRLLLFEKERLVFEIRASKPRADTDSSIEYVFFIDGKEEMAITFENVIEVEIDGVRLNHDRKIIENGSHTIKCLVNRQGQ